MNTPNRPAQLRQLFAVFALIAAAIGVGAAPASSAPGDITLDFDGTGFYLTIDYDAIGACDPDFPELTFDVVAYPPDGGGYEIETGFLVDDPGSIAQFQGNVEGTLEGLNIFLISEGLTPLGDGDFVEFSFFGSCHPDGGDVLDVEVAGGGCVDDGLEENDTIGTAAGLTNGLQIAALVCPFDDDFFFLGVNQFDVITVEALFTHAGGDIDIRLFDPLGAQVAAGLTGTNNEYITHVAGLAGAYAVQVSGVSGIENSYDLTVSTGEAKLTLLPTPCVVYDSPSSVDGPLVAGTPRTIQATGTGTCLPEGAGAVVLTTTAIDPAGAGNLRLSAAGVVPNGGVVNYTFNGLNNSNTVTTTLSSSGALDVSANNSNTDVRLVAVAYYSNLGTLSYVPVVPCAFADSRTIPAVSAPTGTFIGPFAAGANYPDVDVVGGFNGAGDNQGGGNTDCLIPADADAVAVNVVAIAATGGRGGLAVGPGGSNPTENTTNFLPLGMNNAAVAMVPVDALGKIALNITNLDASPQAHIRLVVVGYMSDTAGALGLNYTPWDACAIFDTRVGQGASAPFLGRRAGGSTTTYQITGANSSQGGVAGGCAIPTGVKAVLINLVAIQGTHFGNLRAYATGTSPTGGVLNFGPLTPAMNNSNAVIVPLSALGQINVDVNTGLASPPNAVDIRGVILGYFD